MREARGATPEMPKPIILSLQVGNPSIDHTLALRRAFEHDGSDTNFRVSCTGSERRLMRQKPRSNVPAIPVTRTSA